MFQINTIVLCILLMTFLIFSSVSGGPLFDELFSGYRGYGNSRRSGRRHHGRAYDGGSRYNVICRIHSPTGLAFPGSNGNPVCPY